MTDAPQPPRWTGWCCLLILAVGSLQMVGYALDLPALRGIGAASGFAPFTKVFSDVDGCETFASDFTLILRTRAGEESVIPVDPVFYQQLRGPYNRRNVYGAALSYAPRLPEALWHSVFCHGFRGPLREEFGLPDDLASVTLHLRTRTRGRDDQWTFTPPCLD